MEYSISTKISVIWSTPNGNSGVHLMPSIDQFSLSISIHMHNVRLPHRGAETLFRASLQFVKLMGGRQTFKEVGRDCIYCAKVRKQSMSQKMGPLNDCQVTISPLFYFTMIDLWGPLKSFVPGYTKTTRLGVKPHDVYLIVFVCCVTGCINAQAIEGKSTDSILQGFNRFFSETAVPKICYPDKDGGLVKALSEGEVNLVDLEGTLSRQRGIKFITVVPQGHSAHGKAEKRIHMLQDSLEKSELRKSACTTAGWQTIAKLLEHTVNSVPIGFYHHQTGANSPLLRILTPNNLKAITLSDRAPAGLFSIPNAATDMMNAIEVKYENWYLIWNNIYVPLILDKQKWHFSQENLKVNDIVYFKLTESEMSADWRIGRIEAVDVGRDGFVRVAKVAYKDASSDDTDDWVLRTVERPVRNMVKLFHLEDTSLMDDLNAVYNEAKEILMEDNISWSKNTFEDDDINFEEGRLLPIPVEDVLDGSREKKQRKKRKNELENLEVSMKGWEK